MEEFEQRSPKVQTEEIEERSPKVQTEEIEERSPKVKTEEIEERSPKVLQMTEFEEISAKVLEMKEFEEAEKEQTIKEDSGKKGKSLDRTIVQSGMLPNSMSQPLAAAAAIPVLKIKDIPIVPKIEDNGHIPAVQSSPQKISKSPVNEITNIAEVTVTTTVASQVPVDTSLSQSSKMSKAESKSPATLKSPESKPSKVRQALNSCPMDTIQMQPELVKTENIDMEQSSTMIKADPDEEAMESVATETKSKECDKRLSAAVQEKFLSTATPSSVTHVGPINIGLEIKQEPDSPVEMTKQMKTSTKDPMDVALMQTDYSLDTFNNEIDITMEIKQEKDGYTIPDKDGTEKPKGGKSSTKKEGKAHTAGAVSDEVIPQVLKTNRKRKRIETQINTTVQPAEKKQREREEIEQNEFRERTQGIMTLEPPHDDNFLFCEDCNKEYDMDCPIHGPLLHIQDKQVSVKGDADHALHTIPDGLEVKTSSIPNAGLGVFALQDIQPRVLYGPYGGVKTMNNESAHTSGYAWQIYKDGTASHFVDAEDKSQSNWMRYVNCANTESEQNLVALQYKGEIYFRTYKAVTAGTELLVWYGDDYGKEHRSLQSQNTFLQPKYLNGIEFYSCQFCEMGFTNAAFCAKHLLRSHSKKLSPENFRTINRWLITNDSENSGNKQGTKHISDSACNENEHLNKLMMTHREEKPFKCNTCDYACNRIGQLKNHMRTHTGERPFKCDMCDLSFNLKHHLKQHMRRHTGEKPFRCNVCGYACSNSGSLRKHMMTHTGEKPFKCNICDFACIKSESLKNHMTKHTGEKPFKCSLCDYASNDNGHLKRHMGTHTGEKPFKCSFCDYASNQSGNLKSHMRLHTGEKPYKCSFCDYASNENGHMKTHMRTHTGEKPFKCSFCDYASNRSGELKIHMRRHTGEKPFKCNICDYACKVSGHLKKHMRIHTGEKPYKCNICGYAFNENRPLKNHMKIHTREQTFKCNICDFTCKQSEQLENHMKEHENA